MSSNITHYRLETKSYYKNGCKTDLKEIYEYYLSCDTRKTHY